MLSSSVNKKAYWFPLHDEGCPGLGEGNRAPYPLITIFCIDTKGGGYTSGAIWSLSLLGLFRAVFGPVSLVFAVGTLIPL